MYRLLEATLITLSVLLLLSCSDDSGPASPPDGAPGVDTLLPDLGAGPDLSVDAGRPEACVDQDTKLQAALDSARKSPNAMLVVSNTACGTTVYLSGDSSNATAASLWRVGSVTKTYVAATILTLVRDGKLALDDDLSKWVPGVPDTAGVTVKMLLNHTSGIFNYTDDPKTLADPMKEHTPEELVAIATTGHSPYFAPGAGWHYSNTNYILLGMIAEKAGGAAAHALIRKRALEPAGLDQTFFEGKETLQGKLAAGFDQNKNNVTDKYSMSWPWTAGAMTATGADLCDWIRTLLGTTKVLTAAERQTMLDGVIADAKTNLKYGLGVFMLDPSITAGAGPAMGHGGDIFGYHTQAYWFPDKETAICSVVNQDGTSPNDLTLAALLTLFPK
jgi:D-alanyl-D-alanine carboxypeptidase